MNQELQVAEMSNTPVYNFRLGVYELYRQAFADLDSCAIRPDGLPKAMDYMEQDIVFIAVNIYKIYRDMGLIPLEALLRVLETSIGK